MAEIDTLEVKIKANAQSAAASLNSLASALGKVKTALSNTNKDGTNVTQKLSKSINDLNNALQGITTGGLAKLNAMSDALNKYADALKNIKAMRVASGGSVAKSIKDINDALETYDKMEESKGGSAETDPAEELKDTNDVLDAQWEKVKETTSVWAKFFKSIGRIALYRAIRSALKGIAEAFDTGLKNAYHFSKQSKDFTRLAETLDHIKSITSQMTNQLGAWWGEVKQLVLPAVNWIIDKLRGLFEWLTEVTAALNGEFFYQKAVLVEEEWDKATESVKKYKAQLLGLDELNNLSSQSDKGDVTDYSLMYEKTPVRPEIFNATSWLRSTLKDLTIEVGDIFFDWGNLTEYDIEDKIIVGLSGLTGGLIGGVPGAIIGTLAGVLITLGLHKLDSDNDRSYTKKGLFKVLKPAIFSLMGGIVGLSLAGVKGAFIGLSIGSIVGLALSRLESSSNVSLKQKKLFECLETGMIILTGGFLGLKYGGGKGLIFGLTIGTTVALVLQDLTSEQGNLSLTRKGLFNILLPALTGLVGGVIGFAFGGWSGALLGAQIGVNLGLVIEKLGIDWSAYDESFLDGIKHDLSLLFPGKKPVINSYIDMKTGAVQAKANGGIVPNGSLFYAGEAGAEFVGNIGTTSAVANTGQMTDAIYKAAYMGMSQALKENGGNGFGGFEPATTDDLFIAMRKKASKYNKMTGNSAFA